MDDDRSMPKRHIYYYMLRFELTTHDDDPHCRLFQGNRRYNTSISVPIALCLEKKMRENKIESNFWKNRVEKEISALKRVSNAEKKIEKEKKPR